MSKFCILINLILFSSFCLAGNEVGTVRFNHGQYGHSSTSAGKTFFFLDGGTKTNIPACATYLGGQRWVIDNNWPGANMQLSILLAARMSGKEVQVRGANNCGVHGDTETARDLFIK